MIIQIQILFIRKKYIPSSISYCIKCSYDDLLSIFELFSCEEFFDWIIDLINYIDRSVDVIMTALITMSTTAIQRIQFQKQNIATFVINKFSLLIEKFMILVTLQVNIENQFIIHVI